MFTVVGKHTYAHTPHSHSFALATTATRTPRITHTIRILHTFDFSYTMCGILAFNFTATNTTYNMYCTMEL